jgi:8-oxo-dGTP pyrophosphatase MutT (NUDIX family)
MHDAPEVTASRTVYENRWLRLREDELIWPDGTPGVYAVVEKAHAAVVAAVQDDHVWLVEQFRYTIGRRCWELPQGALDGSDETRGEVIARTELAEETGLRAGSMARLGLLYFACGMSDQSFEAWLATDLTPGEPALEPTEQGLIARPVAFAEVAALVADGRIVDAATVATLSLARLLGPGSLADGGGT